MRAACLCLLLACAALCPPTAGRAQAEGLPAPGTEAASLGLFAPADLVRAELPPGAAGAWALLDALGVRLRGGTLQRAERALYFGGLKQGAYYLFWGFPPGELPSLDSGANRRRCFLVLPAPPAEADPFFVLAQPGLAGAAAAGRTAPGSDYSLTFAALERLGGRRLKTGFGPDLAAAPTASPDAGYDWKALDSLEADATYRGVRFVADLSSDARTSASAELRPPSADYVRALLGRFGFKLDEFVLWPRADALPAADGPDAFEREAGPPHATIQIRSPYASVALGGLAAADAATSPSADLFPGLDAVLGAGARCYDVLDHRADGAFEAVRQRAEALDRLVAGRPAAQKARAICGAAPEPGDASIAAQRRDAAELLKKIAWFRSRDYRYFTLGPVLGGATDRAALFRPDDAGTFQPSLAAGAWAQALHRLGGAKPLPRLAYATPAYRILAFERTGETVFVAWVPRAEADPQADRRIAITLKWPEGSAAEVYDLLGVPLAKAHLRPRDPGRFDWMLTEEPLYLSVRAAGPAVGW